MTIAPISQAENDRLTEAADPVVEYLMLMSPNDAFGVLTAVVSTLALSARHKEGKTALNTLDDHFFPAVRTTVAFEIAQRAKAQDADAPATVMDETKPHHGRIENWHKEGCDGHGGLGYLIMGTLLDHPHIPVKHTNTSLVLKHDAATGEIETRNSRYRLVGPEGRP